MTGTRRVSSVPGCRGRSRLLLLSTILACGTTTADEVSPPPETFLSFSYAVSDESTVGESSATIDTKETRFAAGLFGFGAAERRFDLGLDYQYTRYSYSGLNSRNRDLHRLQVPIGLRATTGRWSLDAFVAPGVATSSNVFKDLPSKSSSDDFFGTAQFEATGGGNATASWLIGGAWDRSFGEARLYPVVGAVLSPSRRLRARIAFPDSAVHWRATKRQSLTLRLYPSGFEWHVLDDDLVTEFDYRVEAWRAEAWWSLQAIRGVYLDLALAWEFARHHEFRDRAGLMIDADVDDALFMTVGLRWRDAPLMRTHRITR